MHRTYLVATTSCLSVLLITSGVAVGHGGLPRAAEIAVAAANPDVIVARTDGWGLFVTPDGGMSWGWLCPEAYSGGSSSVGPLSFALTAEGDVLMATRASGLRRSRDDACGWEAVDGFDGQDVVAVAAAAPNTATFYVLATADGSGEDSRARLFVSTDGAGSFAPVVADPLPSGVREHRMRVAPGDSDYLYITGVSALDARTGVLLASSDGGTTWRRNEVDLWPAGDDGPVVRFRIHAIAPDDPTELYLWLDAVEADVPWEQDRLLLSRDGGESFSTLFESVGDIAGFAVSPDGASLAIAGPEDGLWTASRMDALADGQAAFTWTYRAPMWGLHWSRHGLYAGHDDFRDTGAGRFSVGVSQDGGGTFSPLMGICEVQALACGAGTSTAVMCESRETVFSEAFGSSPRCAPATRVDAGTAPESAAPMEPAEGRGCAVASPASQGPKHWLPWLVLVAVVRRRLRSCGARNVARARRRLQMGYKLTSVVCLGLLVGMLGGCGSRSGLAIGGGSAQERGPDTSPADVLVGPGPEQEPGGTPPERHDPDLPVVRPTPVIMEPTEPDAPQASGVDGGQYEPPEPIAPTPDPPVMKPDLGGCRFVATYSCARCVSNARVQDCSREWAAVGEDPCEPSRACSLDYCFSDTDQFPGLCSCVESCVLAGSACERRWVEFMGCTATACEQECAGG